jgi:hypothetical protein
MIGLLRTSGQHVADNNNNNKQKRGKSMPSVGFKHGISATEQPQTYALDRMTTGISSIENIMYIYDL